MATRIVNGRVIPPDAAVAIGRFRASGPIGYRASGVPEAPMRATRTEAVDDWIRHHEHP